MAHCFDQMMSSSRETTEQQRREGSTEHRNYGGQKQHSRKFSPLLVSSYSYLFGKIRIGVQIFLQHALSTERYFVSHQFLRNNSASKAA